jgi:hypothetical protein
MSSPRGWFADIDRDAEPNYPWQPCLQLDGICHSFQVWFATEAECVAYIKEQILGRGLLE